MATALDMGHLCETGHARQTSRASCAPNPICAGHVCVWGDHWLSRQIYVLQRTSVRPASSLGIAALAESVSDLTAPFLLSDLYHFDHYMGCFATLLPELLKLQSFEVLEHKEEEGVVKVLVQIIPQPAQGGGRPCRCVFVMAHKAEGTGKANCWMTRPLFKLL